ncbi:MAG: glycosyltransferase family 39 protein, partial [Planctomycetaceae bacterium]|nr:glycosyltransferase family 39 protein [Planctomycetaceae bacterium]
MGLPAGGKGIALAALLAALLLLPFLGARHLENPDEPRDAEIGRSFADGSWSTVPRLNGQPYWSKPPLFTGSAGLLMKALGQEEWVPRAAAALHGVAAVAALALLAELLLGGGAGILAGAILLGIPYFLLRMRTCTTDVGLAAWMTLAMALLLLGERRGKVLPSWLGGLAAGGAALAKAVHGLLFPFLAVGIWRGWEREGREGWWRRLLPGFLLGAAAFAAWCLVLRAVDGPEAIDAFLFGNFAKRMTGEAHHAGGPFQYLSLLLRALPITFAAAAGCWAAVRLRDDLGRGLRLPLCWVLSMVLALSLAKGKRDLYLLPVLPGVALLAAGGV